MNISQKQLLIGEQTLCIGNYPHGGVALQVCEGVRQLMRVGQMVLIKGTGYYSSGFVEAPIDFMDSDSTCTYDGCIDIRLDLGERLEITVWDGRISDGDRTYVRARYVFEGEWWRIKAIASEALASFTRKSWDVLTAVENKEREERRKSIADALMADFNIPVKSTKSATATKAVAA